MRVETPGSVAGLADLIRDAARDKIALEICGSGSKRAMLRPVAADCRLSTAAFSGISLYSPEELVLSAGAATPLAEIEAVLASRGQHLMSEAPSWDFLTGMGAPTIGGIVACNLSGPRRVAQGAVRDHVLGLRAVNGFGEVLRTGGRVLKNVAGLDLCKVLAGSFGTYAVITEVTLKILPLPPAQGTVVIEDIAAKDAIDAMSAALGSPFAVSAACYLPAPKKVFVRIEEVADSVAYRCGKLSSLLEKFGRISVIDTAESRAIWRDIKEAVPLKIRDDEALWQISVRPSQGANVLRAVEAACGRAMLDWGGGRILLAGAADYAFHQAVMAAARDAGGNFWLLRGAALLGPDVDCVPAPNSVEMRLARGLKTCFDPAGILNPKRIYRDF
jgi:glycolate oxidase FAD binding subunit